MTGWATPQAMTSFSRSPWNGDGNSRGRPDRQRCRRRVRHHRPWRRPRTGTGARRSVSWRGSGNLTSCWVLRPKLAPPLASRPWRTLTGTFPLAQLGLSSSPNSSISKTVTARSPCGGRKECACAARPASRSARSERVRAGEHSLVSAKRAVRNRHLGRNCYFLASLELEIII